MRRMCIKGLPTLPERGLGKSSIIEMFAELQGAGVIVD